MTSFYIILNCRCFSSLLSDTIFLSISFHLNLVLLLGGLCYSFSLGSKQSFSKWRATCLQCLHNFDFYALAWLAFLDALVFFFGGGVPSSCWGRYSNFMLPVHYFTLPSFAPPFVLLTATTFQAPVCCLLSFGSSDLGVSTASWQTSSSCRFNPFTSKRLFFVFCWHGRIWIACLPWSVRTVCNLGIVCQSISWCWSMFCRLWLSFTTWPDSPLWSNWNPKFWQRQLWPFHCHWLQCAWLRDYWWGRLNTSNIYLCLMWYTMEYCARFFKLTFSNVIILMHVLLRMCCIILFGFTTPYPTYRWLIVKTASSPTP